LKDNQYNSEEFKKALKMYEDARDKGENIYMDSDQLVEIAEYYHSIDDYLHSKEAAQYAASLFPGAIEPIAMLTRIALLVEDDIPEAERYASLADDKNDPDYHFLIAEIMINKECAGKADKYMEDVIEDVEEDEKEDFYLDLCELFIDYEKYQIAEKWLNRCTNTEDKDYKEFRARIAMANGDFKECERIINELIDIDPYYTHYWNQLASSQFMRNDIKSSITSSEYSIAINPEDAEAILLKGNGLLCLNNYEEALKYYRRFQKLKPRDDSGYLLESWALSNLGKIEEAISVLKKAEKQSTGTTPKKAEILRQLAFNESRLEHYDKAQKYIDELERLNILPMDETLTLRGHIYLQMGEEEKAKEMYFKAMKKSKVPDETMVSVATSLYDNGFISKAYDIFKFLEEIYEEVMNDGKDHYCLNNIYTYLALCARAMDKDEEYMEYVRIAVEKNPANAYIHLSEFFPEEIKPENYYNYLLEHKKGKSGNNNQQKPLQ